MIGIENLKEICGIYLITNIINGHKYVGQSTNILKRFKKHHLYDYKNENNSCYDFHLYQAFRKYGLDNFKVEILEECSKEKLDDKEIFWIDYYDSYHNGYNMTKGGQSWSDKIHSIETEKKRQETRIKNQSLQNDNHPRAKLTNQEVINIRQRYINGEDFNNIYKDFKDIYNNPHSLKRIILGEAYQTVGNVPSKEEINNNIKINKKKTIGIKQLTNEQVIEIRNRYKNENISYGKLSLEYNVSSGTIRNIIVGNTYKNIK